MWFPSNEGDWVSVGDVRGRVVSQTPDTVQLVQLGGARVTYKTPAFLAANPVKAISRADLEGQPRFADIAEELLDFLKGSELVIHNAEFDVGFLEHELQLMKHPKPAITDHAMVLDTLTLARELHPGQRNTLDALCKRYEVDASKRDIHGALIDAELLARVYLAMTGGQAALLLDEDGEEMSGLGEEVLVRPRRSDLNLVVLKATEEEVKAHEALLDKIQESGSCLFRDAD